MARPTALTIAGSDSSAGAGIQADIVTFSREGLRARTVVTVVTAQDNGGVRDSLVLPSRLVAAQLDAALGGPAPAAVKTGALGSAPLVTVVGEAAREGRLPNLVVDPVTHASAGGALLDPPGSELLVRDLLPLAFVATPNLDEAGRWIDRPLTSLDDVRDSADDLLALGCTSLVITGGHLHGDPVDVVLTERGSLEIGGPRIECGDLHGTGCIHSAALCAGLALGEDVMQAAVRARRTVEAELSRRREPR